MPIFSLNNFISEVKRSGIARPNRFEVIIPNVPYYAPTINPSGIVEAGALLDRLGNGLTFPSAPLNTLSLTNLFCEISAFPGLNIQTKPYKIQGPARPKPITSEYGGEGLSMTFHMDSDMRVKRLFDNWMHYIINEGSFNVAYKAEYARDIEIYQLNNDFEITYAMRLVDAFPRSMEMLQLNHSLKDATSRLNIVFSFRYWETLPVDGYSYVNHTFAQSTLGLRIPSSYYGGRTDAGADVGGVGGAPY